MTTDCERGWSSRRPRSCVSVAQVLLWKSVVSFGESWHANCYNSWRAPPPALDSFSFPPAALSPAGPPPLFREYEEWVSCGSQVSPFPFIASPHTIRDTMVVVCYDRFLQRPPVTVGGEVAQTNEEEREGHEGNHPRRRLRHPSPSGHPGRQQAAAAGVRQADGLLPAEPADAGRNPRGAGHLHATRPARPFETCSATAPASGCGSSTASSRAPTASPRRSSSAATSSPDEPRRASCSATTSCYGHDLSGLLPGARRLDERRSRSSATTCATPSATAWSSSTIDGRALSLEEKPAKPRSNYAVPGLYFYGPDVCDLAAHLKPSRPRRARDHRPQPHLPGARRAHGRGPRAAAMPGSTPAPTRACSRPRTSSQAIEDRQGLKIGCLEEIAWQAGWITHDEFAALADAAGKSSYGDYLPSPRRSKRRRTMKLIATDHRGVFVIEPGVFGDRPRVLHGELQPPGLRGRRSRPATGCRTTTRAPVVACCAACTTNSAILRPSSCAPLSGRYSTSSSTSAAAARPSAAGSAPSCLQTTNAMLFAPRGMAHGFLVLTDVAEFLYKVDAFYAPEEERSIRWDDPDIGIGWPVGPDFEPILAAKDASCPHLSELAIDQLPIYTSKGDRA